MFRITDIRNIAIQIEKNGEETYRKAGENVADPMIKEMLLKLADDEQRHRAWFESLKDDTAIPPEHADLEKMGQSLLVDMVNSQTFSLEQDQLEQAENITELLEQSTTFENDTVMFYDFLRSLITDKDTAKHLNAIIAEEKGHAERLMELAEALT